MKIKNKYFLEYPMIEENFLANAVSRLMSKVFCLKRS